MRSFFVVGLAALSSAIAIGSLVTGCGSSSCEDTDSCGAYTGGKAGTGGGGVGAGGSGATGGIGGGGGTGGTGGTGGSGGTGGTGGDSGTCDTTKTPSEEVCLVDDQYAVFVNGTASASGTGTKASPFKTIAEALGAAAGKRILVCDTAYDEHVKVTAGVKLYGGFSCTTWAYETGKRAAVKPTSKGYALEVASVTPSFVVEDMEFASIDAATAGESSIAALIYASTDVKLRRVKLAAGKGMAGANAVLTPYTYPTQTSLNGKSASGATGGGLSTCTCPSGAQSIGGKGGDAIPPNGQAGTDGGPNLGGGQGGVSGTPTNCSAGGTGKNGNPGSNTGDAAGATTSGTLTSGAWSPTAGSSGAAGGAGQGAGGGASTSTAGGGGGGCGGCGGAAGAAGGGGGASIALVAIDSTLSIDAGSELTTANAGNGGSGAAGQAGQTDVGFGGLQAVGACPGGSGAAGGNGSAGGGGAGGISVAVMWKGSAAPTIDAGAKITLGSKGSKGTGGKPGSNDGIDGAAQDTLEVK